MVEGLFIGRSGDDAEDRFSKRSTTLELLASNGSLEVTRQRVEAGKHFYLFATDEWSGFEFIFLHAGRLALEDGDETVSLKAGDYMYHNGLPEKVYFRVEENVEMLMVSSKPSFHLARGDMQEMMSLARSVEEKDQTTEGHCTRIERLAVLTGERLGLPGAHLIDVSFGAYLHDIGKVRVPDEILNKAATLTDEEWDEMRRHTDYGAEMLREKEFLHGAAEIVRSHHERYDGGGYPRGLKGEEIPIGARVVAVVDTFDAITSARPYQKAQAKRKAIEELKRHSGTQFDPRVVRAFLEVIGDDDNDEEVAVAVAVS